MVEKKEGERGRDKRKKNFCLKYSREMYCHTSLAKSIKTILILFLKLIQRKIKYNKKMRRE